jgi:hypothetical protein
MELLEERVTLRRQMLYPPELRALSMSYGRNDSQEASTLTPLDRPFSFSTASMASRLAACRMWEYRRSIVVLI